MISKPIENPIIAVSVKVYQVLLSAYPTKFQQEYGPHMLQVFRDCCLRTIRQSGGNGMARLWAITLLDLFRSLIEEHTRKETDMTRSKFIRLSGWSLMLGAVTLFLCLIGVYLQYEVYDPFRRFQAFSEYSFLVSVWATPVLFAVGMLGLRTRYGRAVGNFGKNMLLLGAIAGPAINIIGIYATPKVDWGWILLFTGNAVLLACLTVFGVLALRVKPLPRWNVLPLFAGVWYPALFLINFIVQATVGDWPAITPIFVVVVLMQSIALGVLGYILQADVPEETVAYA